MLRIGAWEISYSNKIIKNLTSPWFITLSRFKAIHSRYNEGNKQTVREPIPVVSVTNLDAGAFSKKKTIFKVVKIKDHEQLSQLDRFNNNKSTMCNPLDRK